MKSTIVIILAVIVSFVCATIATAQIKEGLWEITTKAEMKGMPAQMPATTMRTCISNKDMVPKPSSAQGTGQECKMKEQKITGDRVTYSMECTGKGGTITETAGRMTYKGDVLDGESTTTVKMQGQKTMEMSAKITGKYVGPCTK
jgi:hypothetical protein